MFHLSTFWEWYWDLYDITFGAIQPCPRCHLWPSQDCGYGRHVQDPWSGGWEFECDAPEEELECDGCHHLICNVCKKEVEQNEKELLLKRK